MRRFWWQSAVVATVLVLAGCSSGKSSSAAGTTTVPATSSTSAPGPGNTQYCNLARQVSEAINPTSLNDPTAAFQQFDSLSPSFLAEVPSAIGPDAETAVNAVEQVEASFRAANDDVSKLTAADLAPVESPSFTAATAAITAYDSQMCGITPPTT